ncbi:hypothetical protein KI387_040345 [Taxus chinensis]|uniref:Uncharacterized protein n=1 Tax=Taxus chinensis TaxID=29808 RepID=A0AA38C5M0_TAXCH|nr:hypothetical protein KI387_040345 [Taxus chinensis]
MDRLIKVQERLVSTLDSLASTMQSLQGGRTFKEEPRVSKVNKVATCFEEYQALPEKIRDALTFSEFMNLEKDRVGIGTWSKPRAMHKGNGRNIPTLEEKSPILWAKQGETTKLVEEGTKTPSSPCKDGNTYFPKVKREEELLQQLVIKREQPLGALEAPTAMAKGEPFIDFSYSPKEAQEEEEMAKQEPREREGKEILIVNNFSLNSNGCMLKNTKGTWEHERKDEGKLEEQEGEVNSSSNSHMTIRDGVMTLAPIPKNQLHKVNIAHFVVNNENVLTCDESRNEARGVEHVGEEEGLVGNPSPMKHDDNKLAGLFRTTVNKR